MQRCTVPTCPSEPGKHRHTSTSMPQREAEVRIEFMRHMDEGAVRASYRRTPRSRWSVVAAWGDMERAAVWFERTAAMIRQAAAIDAEEDRTGRPWYLPSPIETLGSILWPEGDEDAPWSPDTLEAVAAVVRPLLDRKVPA